MNGWLFLNAALATFGLCWLAADLVVRWPRLNPRRRYLTVALGILLLGVAVLSLGRTLSDALWIVYTGRSLVTAASVGVITALWVSRDDDEAREAHHWWEANGRE